MHTYILLSAIASRRQCLATERDLRLRYTVSCRKIQAAAAAAVCDLGHQPNRSSHEIKMIRNNSTTKMCGESIICRSRAPTKYVHTHALSHTKCTRTTIMHHTRSSTYTLCATSHCAICSTVAAVFGRGPGRTGWNAIVFAWRERDPAFPQADNARRNRRRHRGRAIYYIYIYQHIVSPNA